MSHQSGETALCLNIKYGKPQGQLFLWVLHIPHGSCSLSVNSRDLRKRCQVMANTGLVVGSRQSDVALPTELWTTVA